MAWNLRAESMFGWSEAEALKMNINSLVPEDAEILWFTVFLEYSTVLSITFC